MTDPEDDYVTCEGCGEDVLAMFELRGDDAVGADALCSKCLADDETTAGSGEAVPTAGSGARVKHEDAGGRTVVECYRAVEVLDSGWLRCSGKEGDADGKVAVDYIPSERVFMVTATVPTPEDADAEDPEVDG